MANTLTNLAGDIYVARDKVSRELVGALSSITINGGSETAALNDTVRSAFAPSVTTGTNTPAMTIPEGTDQVVANKTLTLDKSKGVQIPWRGEEKMSVNNGAGFETIYGNQIMQAMRAIVNEMEADVCTSIYQGASRAFGTAGTTPFATAGEYDDMAETLRILKDNGAMGTDNTLIMDTAAGAKFLGFQADVNRQGTDDILRQGVLRDVAGNRLKESAQVQSHTKGTGTSYTSSTAGFAVGETDIAIITGSGTVVAGDVVTFAGDLNKYLVTTGVAAPGTITIAAPGLRSAIAASAVAMTIGNSYTGNILVSRSAAEIAVRAPAGAGGQDAAVDNMIVVDPVSGIPFDISMYVGFQKSMINVSAVWGDTLWIPEHSAVLLG